MLIGNYNTKRISCPLRRVLKPRNVDVTRLIRLRTSTSDILRPIQTIYRLVVCSTRPGELEELASLPTIQSGSKDVPVKRTRCGQVIKEPQ